MDDLILGQGIEEREYSSSRLQDMFLEQGFKPPSPQNDFDSDSGAKV